MKRFCLSFLGAALMALGTVSCSDDPEEKVVPPDVESVAGIEASYAKGQHEYLEITPDVSLSNDNEQGVTYEWNIGYEVVGTEKTLSYKCSKLGDFNGYFKASSATGAKIVEFTLRVSSPYDRGLLLLSETSEGSMLSFKRLDVMETPVSSSAFRDNNPTLSLGKTPLALCWKGEGITSPNAASLTDEDYEVVISTGDPTTVYTLNSNTLEVKNTIVYDGEGEFHPDRILCPLGVQEALWQGVLYFVGGGRDYIMTGEKTFVLPEEDEKLPDGAQIADYTCSLITEYDDRVRVYFNKSTKKLLYVSAVFGLEVEEGSTVCDIEPMNLMACDGVYYNKRYDPGHVMLVGSNGNSVKVFRFATSVGIADAEEKLSEIDASGHILPTSATGVNPIKPMLYYSRGGDIYRLNYDGENFDASPYISLGGDFDVKQIVFNPFDANTVYIAADNLGEAGEMKASVFVYDVSDNTSAKKLFEDHQAGGSVKQLIYKGNGKEYESISASGQSLLKKFIR